MAGACSGLLGVVVPITSFLVDRVFDAATTHAMGVAFEKACRDLGLKDRTDPVTEIIAEKIIELAQRGEHDPDRICAIVLETYKPPG
jgi:hypothetical protein